MQIRKPLLVLTAAVIAVGTAVPAYAEGSWSSSFTGAATSFESRKWTDNDVDNVSTSVYVSRCTYNFPAGSNMGITLLRNDTFTPDENYGAKTFTCGSASPNIRQEWGDRGKGEFFWRLTAINGQGGTFYRASAGGTGASY